MDIMYGEIKRRYKSMCKSYQILVPVLNSLYMYIHNDLGSRHYFVNPVLK